MRAAQRRIRSRKFYHFEDLKAERELASCLAVYETPISAPPWAGAPAFTSGATAKRQSQVKGALGRAFRF